ncbi:MAG: hypothetical protein JXP73_13270 [Deltaproteobacteria bacterium]|jgi:hypothetical protein|nr:hypothetical protein [Deltaproteobacteria bacterium]
MLRAGESERLAGRKAWFVLAALAAILLTLWSLRFVATRHLLAGHRPEYHALRVLLVADIWRNGEIIPRWVPALAGGLGYPLFIYYGWLAYAFAAWFHVLGLGPVSALNAVTIAAALALAVGAWRLGRELGGKAGGFWAWALFAFAPYQLSNLFVRANYPEYVAGAFAPWALWAMHRTVTGRGRAGLPLCAAFLAAIVLCHNVSGLTLGATVGAAGLLFAATLPAGERKRGMGRAVSACGAAALLCTFFWLPILLGRHDVHLSDDFNRYLDYRLHFLQPRQLVATGWGYGISVPGPSDTMPLQLGIPQVLVFLGFAPLAVVLARRSAWRARVRLAVFALAGLGLAFLTTQWSAPLWTVLAPLALLQFPWRLHLPGTLLAATAGALAVRVFAAPRWRRLRWLRFEAMLATLAAVIVAAASLPYCRPLATYVCGEACLRQLLALGYYTTSIQDEFRPAWAHDLETLGKLMRNEHATLDGVPLPEARLPGADERGHFTLRTQTERPGELGLPIFWFPGWSITVDGVAQPAYPCAGTGVLCTRLAAGTHTLTAAWRPTLVYHLGVAISLLAFAGLVLVVIKRKPPVAGSLGAASASATPHGR